MAGRGRGRGKKCGPSEASAGPVGGGASAEGEMVPTSDHVARPMMMATPLGALIKVEATLLMTTKGGGTLSLGDFYSLAAAHEWLGSVQNRAATTNGGKDEAKTMAPTMAPKQVCKLADDVYSLVGQLSEGERLLFDFVAITGWTSKEAPNLYQLYRLSVSSAGKAQLELLPAPQPNGSATASSPMKTRSEVLGNLYHHSRKHFSFSSSGDITDSLVNWWRHAKDTAQIIADDQKSMAATASTRKGDGGAKTSSFVSSLTTNGTNKDHPSPSKHNGEKKLSLEERVRARSLRSEAIAKSKQSSKTGGVSSRADENKALLELADALRSYSQRRGLVPSSGGSSALDRLKNRASSGAHATNNIARLPVPDLLRDARAAWKSVVNEDHHNDGSGTRRGGSAKVVSIDLGRVLYQLRLGMVSDRDVSDRRQMESQLLGLLEKLATLVPNWLHLRNAPSTSTVATKPGGKVTANKMSAAAGKTKSNIRQRIIVIRNDNVDYADVRAKLGGRGHNPDSSTAKSNNGSKAKVSNGTKRSFQQMDGDKPRGQLHGPVGVADAIVPPSFRRMYGKALEDKE